MRHQALCVAAAILFVCGAASAEDVQLNRGKLANGIRTIIVHAPDAPRQTTFTFLPLTLVNDDPHHAQWSHLVEHMLIRSTDPIELSAPGMMLNGETTHMYLRMETFADADHWKESLQKHAKWLSARHFDPETLVHEKANIQLEEANTAAQGFTSKFALAAWNQVMCGGLEHAAVHGDVANATAEDVESYAAAHVPVDESVLIASIGPAAEADVRAEIERLFGTMNSTHAKPQAVNGQQEKGGGPRSGSWDLPTRHAMWWWRLPDATPATRAAASCIARAIQTQFLMNQGLRASIRQFMAYPCITNSRGSFLVVDCCLAEPVQGADQQRLNIDQSWAKIQPLINELREGGKARGMLSFMPTLILQETPPKPDFTLIRQQLPPMMQDNAEGVWLLGALNFEYSWSVPAEQVFDSLKHLDQQAVKGVIDLVTSEPAGSLLLEPKGPTTQPAPAAH